MYRVENNSGRCRKNVIQKIFRKVEFFCNSEFFRILKYIHIAFLQLAGFEFSCHCHYWYCICELNSSQEEKAQVVSTVKINKHHHLPLNKSKSNKKPSLNTQHFQVINFNFSAICLSTQISFLLEAQHILLVF